MNCITQCYLTKIEGREEGKGEGEGVREERKGGRRGCVCLLQDRQMYPQVPLTTPYLHCMYVRTWLQVDSVENVTGQSLGNFFSFDVFMLITINDLIRLTRDKCTPFTSSTSSCFSEFSSLPW